LNDMLLPFYFFTFAYASLKIFDGVIVDSFSGVAGLAE